AVPTEALFDGRDNRREEGIVEIGNKDGDDPGLSLAQHGGPRVGAIVEGLDRGFDLLDELGANRLAASQHVRDGGRRDASHPRDVIDRTCFFDHRPWAFAPCKTIYCKSFYVAPRRMAREKSPLSRKI